MQIHKNPFPIKCNSGGHHPTMNWYAHKKPARYEMQFKLTISFLAFVFYLSINSMDPSQARGARVQHPRTNSNFAHWTSLSKHYNLHPGPTSSQSGPDPSSMAEKQVDLEMDRPPK